MLVAVDDTDSREGMCTTFLMTELIQRSGLDVIGFPRLVRLNPAIKHKTRGNGALAVNLGYGGGESFNIGNFNGNSIRSFSQMKEETNGDLLLSVAKEVINDFAVLEEPNTNPGVVVSQKQFPEEFYWKAAREEVSINEAESFIDHNDGKWLKFKNGRGIIGAAASLSWPSKNKTYEVLTYRNARGHTITPEMKMKIAEMADRIPGTFNNLDVTNRYAAVFPKDRTPVLMGVRGTDYLSILRDLPALLSDNGVTYDRYLCYQSNQATDDHIIKGHGEFNDGISYEVEGMVDSRPTVITGSHYFSFLNSGGHILKIAAFEPTKEFRELFRQIVPGDHIRVFGSIVNSTLNIEKMQILNLSRHFVRGAPNCHKCGKKMKSKGNEDYRCPACHTRQRIPHYASLERSITPGKYDVPVIARRHISRPFDLESNFAGKLELGAE